MKFGVLRGLFESGEAYYRDLGEKRAKAKEDRQAGKEPEGKRKKLMGGTLREREPWDYLTFFPSSRGRSRWMWAQGGGSISFVVGSLNYLCRSSSGSISGCRPADTDDRVVHQNDY